MRTIATYTISNYSISQGHRTLYIENNKIVLINFKNNKDKTFLVNEIRYLRFIKKHKLFQFKTRLHKGVYND